MQSKLLYTPTVNQHDETSLFGGLIWRCNFISDSDRRRCCLNLTKVMARVIFYYHNVIFRREIKLDYRWVVIELDNQASNTSVLCFRDWKYIVEFFTKYSVSEMETSSNLRLLFGALLQILKTIYYSHTLFLVRTGGPSNRQNALDLLIQVSKHMLSKLTALELTEVLTMEHLLLELKPSQVGKQYDFISERRFDFQVPGSVTYLYHTYQYCSHSNERTCDNCKNNHTAHKDQLRHFLASIHPTS